MARTAPDEKVSAATLNPPDFEERLQAEKEALRAQYSEPRYEITSGGDMGWLRSAQGSTVKHC